MTADRRCSRYKAELLQRHWLLLLLLRLPMAAGAALQMCVCVFVCELAATVKTDAQYTTVLLLPHSPVSEAQAAET